MKTTVILAATLCAASCGKKSSSNNVGSGGSATGSAAVTGSAAGSAAANAGSATGSSQAKPDTTMPAGWSRVDLSTMPNPLPISIAVPPDAKVARNAEPKRDENGLPIESPLIEVSGKNWKLEFRYNTYARSHDDVIANHSNGTKAKILADEKAASGAWVVIAEANKPNLFVEGGDPATNTTCSSMTFDVSAKDEAVAMCLSMTKSKDVPKVSDDDSYSFDALATDRSAQKAAAAAKHAILKNDGEAFAKMVSAKGMMLDKKKLSVADLQKQLTAKPLQELIQWTCTQDAATNSNDCQWSVQGTDGKTFALDRSSGYGKVRSIGFEKEADAWTIKSVTTVDHGEP